MDEMPCGESGCICRCQGGCGHACGCDCPHDEDCDCEECVPDDEYHSYYSAGEDGEEQAEGACDHCAGFTAEDLERAAEGSGINPVCACAIGQGANPDDCVCGPRETPKDNTR